MTIGEGRSFEEALLNALSERSRSGYNMDHDAYVIEHLVRFNEGDSYSVHHTVHLGSQR